MTTTAAPAPAIPADRDDSDERFSLLEMDGPTAPYVAPAVATVATVAPTATAAIRFCECSVMTRGRTVVRLGAEVCGRCGIARRPIGPARTVRPVDVDAERADSADQTVAQAPAELAAVAAEAGANAATIGLVRGGIIPSDVNPIAGYNTRVTAVRGERTRYVSRNEPRPDATDATGTKIVTLAPSDLISLGAEGSLGSLVSWHGQGRLPLARVAAVAAEVGLTAEESPGAISAHGHAGRALADVRNRGAIRVSAAVKADITAQTPDADVSWDARWTVERGAGEQVVGASAGTILAVVTLRGEELAIDSTDQELARAIRERYDERRAGEILDAAVVTAWIGRVISGRGGISLGGSWFVPRAHVATISALCSSLRKIWGTRWMLPMLPISRSAELQDGLAASLVDEARAVVADAVAACEGREKVQGRTVERCALDLHAVAARIRGARQLLGERSALVAVAGEIEAAIRGADGLADAMATRFALIVDELRRDGEI